MDRFLYGNDLRHERVKIITNIANCGGPQINSFDNEVLIFFIV